MNAGHIVHQKADIIIVDLRDDDVLRFIRPRHIKAARQVHQRHGTPPQREQAVDIRMRLRHRRYRKIGTGDDFAYLRYVNPIIYSANIELDDFEFIRAGFQQNALFISHCLCHVCRPQQSPFFLYIRDRRGISFFS